MLTGLLHFDTIDRTLIELTLQERIYHLQLGSEREKRLEAES